MRIARSTSRCRAAEAWTAAKARAGARRRRRPREERRTRPLRETIRSTAAGREDFVMSSDRAALVLFGALSLLPNLALAQDAQETQDGQEAQPPEASEAEEAPDPRVEEARERFRQGLALAEAGNCSGAIAEFNASLAIVPRANTLFNIARCQETLNRYDLAIRAYEQYLALAPPDDPDRASVDATMRQLRNLLGTIHVASNVSAEVWLEDRVVGE